MANNVFQKTRAALSAAETRYSAIQAKQKSNEEELADAKAAMDSALEDNNAAAFTKAHDKATLCEYRAEKYAATLRDHILPDAEYESIRRTFESEMHSALSAKYSEILTKLQPVVDILGQIDKIAEEAGEVSGRARTDSGKNSMLYNIDGALDLRKHVNRIADLINEYMSSK